MIPCKKNFVPSGQSCPHYQLHGHISRRTRSIWRQYSNFGKHTLSAIAKRTFFNHRYILKKRRLYGCDCAHARLFFRAIYGRQFRSRSIFWRWSEGLWFRRNRKVSGFNGNRRKPCRRFREKDSFCGEFWVRCFVTIYQVFFPDNSQMLDCHLFDDIRTGNQYQVAGTSTPAKQFPIMQRSIKSPGWISVQVPEEPVSILSAAQY